MDTVSADPPISACLGLLKVGTTYLCYNSTYLVEVPSWPIGKVSETSDRIWWGGLDRILIRESYNTTIYFHVSYTFWIGLS